jgi:hypothetical protein
MNLTFIPVEMLTHKNKSLKARLIYEIKYEL